MIHTSAAWFSGTVWPDFLRRGRARRTQVPSVQRSPLGDVVIRLAGDGHASIAAVPGLAVRVRAGALWITQHGDRKDHVVRAGERFIADRAGTLVVSGLSHGELALEWPAGEIDQSSTGLQPTR